MATRIHTKTGWLRGARRVLSPNCDDRPPYAAIDLILIHGISLPPGHYGGEFIDQLFTNRLRPEADPYFRNISHLQVSAHVLICRDGSLTQYVPFHKRAWHAGESCFEGRPCCNDFSIGIELEGTDDAPYAAAQYRELARLAAELMAHWPLITAERIVGHCHVAPGRKTDPGPVFDWDGLRKQVKRWQKRWGLTNL
ncbi:MAG: 1,6-anhydro-N-acetylmuramyl-L-alanine amidase AmpD [Gammaproteobacteria bacterium]